MKNKVLWVLPVLVLLLIPADPPAFGQEDAHAAAAVLPPGNTSVWQQQGAKVLGLTVLLVGVGYAVVWRNTRRGQKNRQDGIRVVSVKALGPKEKVAILEMAGSRLVLGVTARNITLLYREPEVAPPAGGDKEREE